VRRARRGSKAPDDRRQGSGRKKAIGERHTSTRGGTQLRRVGSYVISMGAGLFTDLRGSRYESVRTNQRHGLLLSRCAYGGAEGRLNFSSIGVDSRQKHTTEAKQW
jgi:hypothetical protein